MGSLVRIALTLTFLSGCSVETADDTGFIPDVPVECTAAQAADCSGTGLAIFVGIKTSLGADCDDFLAGSNATQRRQMFEASATSTTGRSGIYLTATLDAWEDSVGGAVYALNSGTYQVCGFVDTDGDGTLDTNEPVGTGSLEMGATSFVLETWAPAFN